MMSEIPVNSLISNELCMEIKLSIITPVCNGKKFIQECIENVIKQQCPEVEHNILDACSTDGTVDIIRSYAEKYPHIRWKSEEDNGQSDAMNKGIAMARGSIISFLNVDDFYEPNTLNQIIEIMNELPEPTLLVGNCNVWDDHGNLLFVNKPSKLKLHQLLLGLEINPWPINPSAYFYHKSLHEVIGLYSQEEHYALDLDFILRAVQVANVKYIDEIWGNYRLLKGTKTVTDQESGKSKIRGRAMLKAYRKDLPSFFRSTFWIYSIFAREFPFYSRWIWVVAKKYCKKIMKYSF